MSWADYIKQAADDAATALRYYDKAGAAAILRGAAERVEHWETPPSADRPHDYSLPILVNALEGFLKPQEDE